MNRVTRRCDLGLEQVSDQLLIAPTFAGEIGNKGNQVVEMPVLLLSDHVVKGLNRLVWTDKPGFGDAHADESVSSKDETEPTQGGFDRVESEVDELNGYR